MADAVPSRPGANLAANTSKVTLPVAKGEEVGRNKKGRYVRRVTMTNGDIREDFLHEADAPEDVVFLDAPKAAKPDVRPLPKKKGS